MGTIIYYPVLFVKHYFVILIKLFVLNYKLYSKIISLNRYIYLMSYNNSNTLNNKAPMFYKKIDFLQRRVLKTTKRKMVTNNFRCLVEAITE